MNGRESFLQRVRQAVADGNRAGVQTALPERGNAGYQGGGADLVECFKTQFLAAGGVCHAPGDVDAARTKIVDLASACAGRRILLGAGPVIDALNLEPLLRERGYEVTRTDAAATSRDVLFAADIGISGVAYLIAETGSIVAVTSPEEPRGLTLLPPVHIAVASRNQILPDLFDLHAVLQKQHPPALPSCVTLITGPSKTGDIELRLVTGVHGPGEVHVVLTEPV
jgi:L-lactate dehydrogenase complex protein LldG